MQGKGSNQSRMVQVIDLDTLIPPNYILRLVDRVIDLSFIRAQTAQLYAAGKGRPAIPPELVLRLFMLQYLFNLSERALCSEVTMHAGYRWFCRLNFDDPVPDRSTLARVRRLWAIAGIFADAMRSAVAQCVRAGLLSATALGPADAPASAPAPAPASAPAPADAAHRGAPHLMPALPLDEWLIRQAHADAATSAALAPAAVAPDADSAAPGAGGGAAAGDLPIPGKTSGPDQGKG